MRPMEGEKFQEPRFKWLKERGTRERNKDVQFYESFIYDGEVYSLYDAVFMHAEGDGAYYIGKLVKIWEEAGQSRKIKVQWFFRPSEISYYLRDVGVLENEIFFGSGHGIGLANISPLEAIAGKCKVVCISTDTRNPQPSAEEVKMANYVFYRIFDVQSCTVSDQMPCIVGGLPVGLVFNIKESNKTLNIPKFDSKRKYNARNTITSKETWRLACKSSPKQLESLKLNENCDHLVEEEDTSATQVQAKKKSLLGETKLNKGSTHKRKCSSVDVNSSKDAKPLNTIENRSTLDAIVGYKVNKEDDKVKHMMSLVDQVNIKERVRFLKKSCDLGDSSLKRAKLVKTLSNGICTHDVHGLSIPGTGNDAMRLMIGTTSCDANSKSKHLANAGLEKVSKLAKDLNALEKKLYGTNAIVSSEKPKSGHAHKFACSQKDLKTSKSSSTCRNRSFMSDEVSANKTSKFGRKEEFGKIGQLARFIEDSGALGKRFTKSCAYPSSGKPNHGQDFGFERENITLAYHSSPKKGRPSKKVKLDDSIKIFEVNHKVVQKLEESFASKMKNYSPFTVSLNDNESKSKLPKHLGKFGKGCSKEYYDYEMDKLFGGNLSKLSVTTSKGDDKEAEGRIFEATQRPIIEKSKWFKLKELSWEESVKTASDEGTLVLLQNFDTDFTSGEVEDIIWHAFNEHCRGRMLQHTAISNPHYGRALVIFRTSEVAEKVVKKLDDRCLMLPNQRPLVGCTVVLSKLPGKQMTFVGHFSLDKVRQQLKRERKEGVSTSHYSQINTIEYEMAAQWCLLQSKSDVWWQNLFELQMEKLKKLMANLKSKCTSTAI